MNKTSGPFLLSVDTQEMPGKAILRLMTFHTEIVPWGEFDKSKYQPFDTRLPEAAALRFQFEGEPQKGGTIAVKKPRRR